MALEYKRTPEELRADLEEIARDFGFTRLDRFVGSTIDVFVDTYSDLYGQLDDLEDQTRIDTATGRFLDSWGIVLAEPRDRTIIMEDLSVNNVFIATSDGTPVSNYTRGGASIFIPDGTRILDDSGTPVLATLDGITIGRDRAFTRVVGLGNNITTVQPGTYRLDGSIQDFVLGRASGSVPRAQAILEDVDLVAVVQRPITGNRVPLTDEDYRFILFSKANSINKANKAKVDTLLSDNRVARFVVREFTGGSSSVAVYIEPTRGILGKSLEESMKIALQRILPYGTVIHTSRMVTSTLEMDFRISVQEGTPIVERDRIREDVITSLREEINGLNSGSTFNIDLAITQAQRVTGVGDVFLDSVRVNGRTLFADTYPMQEIEKLFVTDGGVTVDVI